MNLESEGSLNARREDMGVAGVLYKVWIMLVTAQAGSLIFGSASASHGRHARSVMVEKPNPDLVRYRFAQGLRKWLWRSATAGVSTLVHPVFEIQQP